MDLGAETAETFTAYGTSHQVALGILVVGAVGLVAVGRATRDPDRGDRVGKGMAVAMVGMTIPLQILYFTPSHWNLQTTLPIQLCDLGSFVAAYALWTHRPWAVGLTYYWGLTLATQALITPDVSSVFPSPMFLLYWGMHMAIVWAAVYLTWGAGQAPTWHTYRTSLVITAVWGVVTFAFNLAVGTNYGYLNEKPKSATILDLLGEWPTYLVAEVVILAVVWALTTWPWVALVERRRVAHEVLEDRS
jgi:hypothetical integral membrane protein (TIGR02206 family)